MEPLPNLVDAGRVVAGRVDTTLGLGRSFMARERFPPRPCTDQVAKRPEIQRLRSSRDFKSLAQFGLVRCQCHSPSDSSHAEHRAPACIYLQGQRLASNAPSSRRCSPPQRPGRETREGETRGACRGPTSARCRCQRGPGARPYHDPRRMQDTQSERIPPSPSPWALGPSSTCLRILVLNPFCFWRLRVS